MRFHEGPKAELAGSSRVAGVPTLHSRIPLHAHTCSSCLPGPMTPLCTMRSLAFCCLLLAPLAGARELQASGCTQVPEECTKVDCNGETGVEQPPPPLPPALRCQWLKCGAWTPADVQAC